MRQNRKKHDRTEDPESRDWI